MGHWESGEGCGNAIVVEMFGTKLVSASELGSLAKAWFENQQAHVVYGADRIFPHDLFRLALTHRVWMIRFRTEVNVVETCDVSFPEETPLGSSATVRGVRFQRCFPHPP